MSDRYQQPERGTYTDTWDVVMNQNFYDIGEDIESLLAESTVWHLEVGEPIPAEAEPGDTIIRYEP